ncbi:MAG: Amuc_1100 family pilus-like protein [Planctomycetes bacterium]|nr:Amuc_1100 family pilus-like protein [Planctomycetota bacterium]
MKLAPSDRRFLATVIITALFTLAVLLVTSRFFADRIETLQTKIDEIEPQLAQSRKGKFLLDKQISQYRQLHMQISDEIDELKTRLEFPFPEWVTPPKESNPGEYFRTMHSQWRMDATSTCTVKGVQLLDGNLGFSDRGVIDRARATEDLQNLSIVVKLIYLLADVKVTAITRVAPEEPIVTGSFRREKNPQYVPRGGQPKMKVVPNPAFIREYPVRLEIITDVTTLMRFLSSVRQEKQFFLISDISISTETPGDKKVAEMMKPGQVYVKIAAAAMRFLSPEEHAEQVKKVRIEQQWYDRFKSTGPVRPKGY